MEYSSRILPEILDKFDQILESINVIKERTSLVDSVDELMSTPWGMTTLDACTMRIQVIGELVRNIDHQTHYELFSKFPTIPWNLVIGLRNIISHQYFNIDYDIIWKVIKEDLPIIEKEILSIKEYLSQSA